MRKEGREREKTHYGKRMLNFDSIYLSLSLFHPCLSMSRSSRHLSLSLSPHDSCPSILNSSKTRVIVIVCLSLSLSICPFFTSSSSQMHDEGVAKYDEVEREGGEIEESRVCGMNAGKNMN